MRRGNNPEGTREMAKKDRNKRSGRKARAAERERVAAEQAAASGAGSQEEKSSISPFKKKSVEKQGSKEVKETKERKRGGLIGYLHDVKVEMQRVTWPSRKELKDYSIAVIASLIVAGVAVWLVDTGVVALLVALASLRS